MSDRKPWRPRMSSDPEFNPFCNAVSQGTRLRDRLASDEWNEDVVPYEVASQSPQADSHQFMDGDERRH